MWADAIWCRGTVPPPALTVSQWADANRILPGTNSEPGPWRTERTPYLREIMDALSTESGVEVVVFMAGSQIGKTEAGLNWIGYLIDHAPGLAMAIMPTLDMVKRNVRTRIDPMIETTPALSRLIGPGKSKDAANNMQVKMFAGGQLVMTGANSASSLRSTPARYLCLDEVDAFPLIVDDEGDPVELAIRRTATFRSRRKILMVSTPTVKGFSRIDTAFENTDQRKFFVPCPECGHMAPITWARIKWPKGKRREAYLLCEECGGIAEEHQKMSLLRKGEWRATVECDNPTVRGYHLPGLYSPFESWAEQAIKHDEARKDPARLQVWTNTVLAETWEDLAAESLDPLTLRGRRGPMLDRVPKGAAVLTAGVDTQDNRLEVQVVAWGVGDECWIIRHEILMGDPSGPAVWQALEQFLTKEWACEDGPGVTIRATCVDTGGHHTASAYEFIRTRFHQRIWGIKGSSTPSAPPFPRRPSYKNAKAVPLFLIGTNALKDELAARLAKEGDGPGTVHVVGNVPDDFFDQLTSERRHAKFIAGRPVRVWIPKSGSARSEAWDCLVYASAALHGLKQAGLSMEQEQSDRENWNTPRSDKMKRSSFVSRGLFSRY